MHCWAWKNSRLNNSKNKLRNRLAVCTLEALIKSSEKFPGDWSQLKTCAFTAKARKKYFENSEAVDSTIDDTCLCELQPAGEL